MASTNYKLGTYIELREVTNANFTFGPDDVRGVNNLTETLTIIGSFSYIIGLIS